MTTHNKINNKKLRNCSLLKSKNKSKEEFMHSRLIASNIINDVSFSMFYDNKKKINQSILKYNISNNSPKRNRHHFKNIESRNLKLWVDDKNVTKCYKCNSEFSFFL